MSNTEKVKENFKNRGETIKSWCEARNYDPKAKALPFDGRIDPYKHHDKVLADDNTLFMPKKGQRLTEHESRAPSMFKPLKKN